MSRLAFRLAIVSCISLAALISGGVGAAAEDTLRASLFSTGDRGGETLTTSDAGDLASDMQSALATADADLKTRQLNDPDAVFVVVLRKAFLANRAARAGASSELTTRYAPRATDPAVPINATLAKGIRQLFVDQIKTLQQFGAKEPVEHDRIIGGSTISGPSDVVAITEYLTNPPGHVCSGVLVTPTAVVTAAHCICLGVVAQVRVGARVFDGHAVKEYPIQSFETFTPCPDHLASENPGDYEDRVAQSIVGVDLAYLKLSEPVQPVAGYARALLPLSKFGAWRSGSTNYYVRVAGYGFTSVNNSGAGSLQFADIGLATADCSAADDAPTYGCALSTEFVADGRPQKPVAAGVDTGAYPTTCGGDSGGPAYAAFTDGKGKDSYYLVGVVSRGVHARCDAGNVMTLIATAPAQCWLKTKIKDLNLDISGLACPAGP